MKLIRFDLLGIGGELHNSAQAGLFLLLLSIITDCATVGVNSYQDAETLGKGKYTAGLALECGRKMDAGIETYSGNIEIQQDPLNINEFLFPILELGGQYGITGVTDIGLALGSNIATNQLVFSLKQKLLPIHQNFAIALMPSFGIFSSTSENSEISLSDTKYEERDKFSGTLLNVSVIISKRWDNFSFNL